VIAQEWSPACAHSAFPEGDLSRLFDMIGRHGMAEDCLYLNVFTPSEALLENSGPLPVMVWV
jgi:carboxylesterase type B